MADHVSHAWADLTSAAPSVKITTLPSSLFKFPPAPFPNTLPPPADHPTLAHPFTVSSELYNATLSINVPITVALVYASIVTYLNSVNADRKWKPWAISRTRVFKLFVILHNVLLAAYSAWTFVGMVNALRLSFAPWHETGLAGSIDSLCKLHGPRGPGSAATYNERKGMWGMTNRAFHLAADGLGPESSDVGRIWNEGLAFYGWLFYLSKFYEVVDTLIILAKGKKSTFLQTYHHAGAMLCMWAGIRYMSPPIWMFVLVNSGIHAIMYTFYLCSVLRIRVPKRIKQTLTTLQITQFVVGALYAFSHLFIAYQVSVSVPYLYHLGSAASKIAEALPSDASSAASTALATASAGVGALLKKAAFRAAGREGLAENVVNEQGRTFGVDAVLAAEDFATREETRFRDELQWTHCLDTSGQVFAILLNCFYLLPLTWLFVRFFISAYRGRVEKRRSSSTSERAAIASQSFADATKGVARRVSEVVEEMHGTVEELGEEDAVVVDADEIRREIQEAADITRQKINRGSEKAKEQYSKLDANKLKEDVKSDIEKMRGTLAEKTTQAREHASQMTSGKTGQAVKEKAGQAADVLGEVAQKAKDTATEAAKAVKDKVSEAAPSEEEKKNIKKKTKDTAHQAKEKAKNTADQAKEATSEPAENAKDKASETAETAKDEVEKHEESATSTSKEEEIQNLVSAGLEQLLLIQHLLLIRCIYLYPILSAKRFKPHGQLERHRGRLLAFGKSCISSGVCWPLHSRERNLPALTIQDVAGLSIQLSPGSRSVDLEDSSAFRTSRV